MLDSILYLLIGFAGGWVVGGLVMTRATIRMLMITRLCLAIYAVCMAGTASADPLVLFSSGRTGATFTELGNDQLQVTSPGITQEAIYEPDGNASIGSFLFSAASLTGSPNSPIWTEAAFTYTSPLDSLSGEVVWQYLFSDDTRALGRTVAGLLGTLTISQVSGNPDFVAAFNSGSGAVTAYLLPPCALDLLASGQCPTSSEFGWFDGGSVLGAADPVPEPSSAMLLLAALGLLFRFRGRACRAW